MNKNREGNYPNAIKIFNNPEFGEIRTALSEKGKALFNLADICRALDIDNPSQVKARLKASGIQLLDLHTLYGSAPLDISKLGNTFANFIDEPNLYRCVFQSRKPEAEKFQDWIFEEVIPTLQDKGGYVISQETDTPESIMARALIVAQDALNRHAQKLEDMKQQNNILEGQKELLHNQNAILAPKAQYTDDVLQSVSTFTTTQVAQGLGMTAQKLNKKLQELGIQYRQSGQWLLKGLYKEMGIAKVRVHTYYNEATDKHVTTQALVWTEKGRLFLHEKRKNEML